jgi:putative Holliday junction resolvase
LKPAKDPSAAHVILAFDFGRRRIGVACGDSITRTASPAGMVSADAAGPRWVEIESLLRTWTPDLVVVGLPYNVDGSESALTADARRFAAQFAERFALEVAMVDERYSSMDAQSRLKTARESGLMRRKVSKADIDAAAACVILERWFTEKDWKR